MEETPIYDPEELSMEVEPMDIDMPGLKWVNPGIMGLVIAILGFFFTMIMALIYYLMRTTLYRTVKRATKPVIPRRRRGRVGTIN